MLAVLTVLAVWPDSRPKGPSTLGLAVSGERGKPLPLGEVGLVAISIEGLLVFAAAAAAAAAAASFVLSALGSPAVGPNVLSVGVLAICWMGLLTLNKPSCFASSALSVCEVNSSETPGSFSSSSNPTRFFPILFTVSTSLRSRTQSEIRSPRGLTLQTAPHVSSLSSISSPISPSASHNQLRSTSAGFLCRKVIVHLPPSALRASSHIGLIPSLNTW